MVRVVVIPGMGCFPAKQSNWYSWFADEMAGRAYVTECVLRDFPDPKECKESAWVPFLEKEIGLDDTTVLVGHSTGAACAMRLLEGEHNLLGAVLVAATHTDGGIEAEARSEYFNRPWDWEKMKGGAKHIVCFHGTDDPLIPVADARHVASKLRGDNFEYVELPKASHFFEPWQEILDQMDEKFGRNR